MNKFVFLSVGQAEVRRPHGWCPGLAVSRAGLGAARVSLCVFGQVA